MYMYMYIHIVAWGGWLVGFACMQMPCEVVVQLDRERGRQGETAGRKREREMCVSTCWSIAFARKSTVVMNLATEK